MVIGGRELSLAVRARLLILIVAPAVFFEACGVQTEVRRLREMPTVIEAVVAPPSGRLLPSVNGSGHGIEVPEEVFALSPVLADVLACQALNGQAVVPTIAPGDRVQILAIDDDPQGFTLVRTASKTYCWLSSSSLAKVAEPSGSVSSILSGES